MIVNTWLDGQFRDWQSRLCTRAKSGHVIPLSQVGHGRLRPSAMSSTPDFAHMRSQHCRSRNRPSNQIFIIRVGAIVMSNALLVVSLSNVILHHHFLVSDCAKEERSEANRHICYSRCCQILLLLF